MPGDILVRTDNLRKEYGDTVAVRDVCLKVERGAVFALVGPNGAGKTTLLRMIAALLEPTEGTAVVGGLDVRRHPRQVHALLGYLPDFFGLYEDLRVCEYLEYFARAYRLAEFDRAKRLADVLALVGLSDRRDDPVAALSRGMRQRLAIARTLIHDPPLLLLDEPASGLDPESRHALQVLFRDLGKAGKTLVVSSHILTELEDYCTHVAIMDRGVLRASGEVGAVRKSLGRGRRIRIRTAGERETAFRIISQDPKAANADGDLIDYAGDDAELAALLKRLVDAGVPVVFFGEEGGGIEDTYLSVMGHRPQ